MKYSQYLFGELLKLYNYEYATLEYDLQYESLESYYQLYCRSKFYDVNKGEYECIVDYLKHTYPNSNPERNPLLVAKDFPQFVILTAGIKDGIIHTSHNNKGFKHIEMIGAVEVIRQSILNHQILKSKELGL